MNQGMLFFIAICSLFKNMMILSQEQKQQLQEISEKLKELRMEKYISLTEVAAQTHIRLAYLQDLELLNFAELPEPIFIQGFIRRYAEYLGLDGNFWANKLTVNFSPIVEQNSQEDASDLDDLYIFTPLILTYVVLLLTAAATLFYLVKSQNTSPKPQSSAILLMYFDV